ncbi:MAG: PIN domain-containing protein [Clostridiales bacterium]|jgi:predicted nucleic acid-binding protein|nr:PIN domain-containing protein [Clostridiales bacterium]MDR2713209.1 PIN domain-containing protein [Clostridiales bacterium]
MKIVIDNNIALDAFLGRQPFNEAAEQILAACADPHQGCLSVNSLTDIFYVLRKSVGIAAAKTTVKKLMELFEIISVNSEDCLNALSLPIDDFADAIIVICGKKSEADCIVTRDEKFLQAKSPVPVITPGELLGKLY